MKSLVIPRSAACRKSTFAIFGAKPWNGEKLGDELALLSLPHEEIHARDQRVPRVVSWPMFKKASYLYLAYISPAEKSNAAQSNFSKVWS